MKLLYENRHATEAKFKPRADTKLNYALAKAIK
jgi:hypothetical protein